MNTEVTSRHSSTLVVWWTLKWLLGIQGLWLDAEHWNVFSEFKDCDWTMNTEMASRNSSTVWWTLKWLPGLQALQFDDVRALQSRPWISCNIYHYIVYSTAHSLRILRSLLQSLHFRLCYNAGSCNGKRTRWIINPVIQYLKAREGLLVTLFISYIYTVYSLYIGWSMLNYMYINIVRQRKLQHFETIYYS